MRELATLIKTTGSRSEWRLVEAELEGVVGVQWRDDDSSSRYHTWRFVTLTDVLARVAEADEDLRHRDGWRPDPVGTWLHNQGITFDVVRRHLVTLESLRLSGWPVPLIPLAVFDLNP